jgi:hypothetical protein
MLHINLPSSPFTPGPSSTLNKVPKYINWDYYSNKNDMTFYIDADVRLGILNKNDGKRKFLWGIESRYFDGGFENYIKANLKEVLETYEAIFTYNNELIKLNEKFKWCPAMGYWIETPNIKEKIKLVSMICSDKQMTGLQVFRKNYALKNRNKIHVYGSVVGNRINKKEEGLEDYCFSVCIENDEFDSYFTEKILDCFATGTIPIYKGTKKVTEHFNPDGILFVDDVNLDDLSYELYISKLEAVKDNFNRVQKFAIVEDWIFENYLKDIV